MSGRPRMSDDLLVITEETTPEEKVRIRRVLGSRKYYELNRDAHIARVIKTTDVENRRKYQRERYAAKKAKGAGNGATTD